MTPEQTEGKHSAVVCLALYFLLITVLRSEVKDIKVSIQQKEKKKKHKHETLVHFGFSTKKKEYCTELLRRKQAADYSDFTASLDSN